MAQTFPPGVRNGNAGVSRREITVFDSQAWQSRLRRDTWQVYNPLPWKIFSAVAKSGTGTWVRACLGTWDAGTQYSFIRGGSAQRFKPLSFNIVIFTKMVPPFIYLELNCTPFLQDKAKTIEFPIIATFCSGFQTFWFSYSAGASFCVLHCHFCQNFLYFALASISSSLGPILWFPPGGLLRISRYGMIKGFFSV